MKKIFPILVIVSVIVLFEVFSPVYAAAERAATPSVTNKPLTTTEIQDTISSAVMWLTEAQEEDGHFRYEYIPFLDRYVDDDNIVRQTGAFYVLSEVLAKDKENLYDLKEVLQKSMSYFEQISVTDEAFGYDFKCILTGENVCALGATGLALTGLLDLIAAYPDLNAKYEEYVSGYLNFILVMKMNGKGFRGNYYFDKSQSESESSFSNGEAFLALARHYQYSPTKEVKEVIDSSFEYFDETYRAEWDPNFYLWGMAGIKTLYEISPSEDYFSFVIDYTDWRISKHRASRNSSHNKCAYVEGIASAYSVISPNVSEDDDSYYMEEINFWLTKSKELQVNENDSMRIRYNNRPAKKLEITKPKRAVGGFLTDFGEPTQRIDFTQHCLSSYLQKIVDIEGKNL